MAIFISWSGPRSEAVAKALHGWLPKIINAFKPWLSSADIDKGARWGTDVAVRLQAAKAGIICVTPSNLHSDWILFEAGALSKTLQNTFVCPLLIGLEPTDVKGPLAQFQATKTTKGDVLRLLKTLNSGLGEHGPSDAHIEEAFEVWWPKLDADLKKLPPEETSSRPHRTDRDVLEEILGLVRNQNRSSTRESPSTELPEKRRRDIVSAVFKAINELDPAVDRLATAGDPSELRFVAYSDRLGKEQGHHLVLPRDIPLSEIADSIKTQIATASADVGVPKRFVPKGKKGPGDP